MSTPSERGYVCRHLLEGPGGVAENWPTPSPSDAATSSRNRGHLVRRILIREQTWASEPRGLWFGPVCPNGMSSLQKGSDRMPFRGQGFSLPFLGTSQSFGHSASKHNSPRFAGHSGFSHAGERVQEQRRTAQGDHAPWPPSWWSSSVWSGQKGWR